MTAPLNANMQRAVVAHPELWQLLTTVCLDKSWRFFDYRDQQPPHLVFARRWPSGWTDVLIVSHRDGAMANRFNPLEERVWTTSGTLLDVLHDLEELPAPETRLAPHLIIPGRGEPLPTLHPVLPGQRRPRALQGEQ